MGRATGSSGLSHGPKTTGAGRAPNGEPFRAVMETHTSLVLLLGDRACRVMKPVRLTTAGSVDDAAAQVLEALAGRAVTTRTGPIALPSGRPSARR